MSADNIQIGARVVIKGKPGVVKFIGTTKFAPGEWVGVELDMPYGKNNGAVDGTRYFKCDKPISQGFFGIFVHPNLVDIDASKFGSPRKDHMVSRIPKTPIKVRSWCINYPWFTIANNFSYTVTTRG